MAKNDDDTLMLSEQYRPYSISDIIGQPQAKRVAGSWLRTGRIPRSILISGEYSAGKTTLARIISRAALCVEPKNGEACGECGSCKSFDDDRHPDYIEMNSASDRGIDAMRMLASKVRMMPTFGKRRVIVMDEAHEVTKSGWGAMLKPLEEPPKHVVFIIVTTNPEKILDTITSRCSRIKLSAIAVEECTEMLEDVAKSKGLGKVGLTKAHLTKIAKVTGSHPRNALHALEQIYTMVLDATEGGQIVDSALINVFIKDVATTDIDTLAAGIVNGVLLGKPGGALKRASDAWSQSDLLLTKVTEMMRQAMLLSTNPKLIDPYFENVFDGCGIFDFTTSSNPVHIEARKAVLEAYAAFTQLRIQTSNHTVPVAEVIGEAIARSALICQEFLKRNRGTTKVLDVKATTKTSKRVPEKQETA